jgi:hypothetical protein
MPKKGVSFYVTRETFQDVIRSVYNANPDLVPFHNGDRASQINHRSAKDFAAFKIYQSAHGGGCDSKKHRRPHPKNTGENWGGNRYTGPRKNPRGDRRNGNEGGLPSQSGKLPEYATITPSNALSKSASSLSGRPIAGLAFDTRTDI